jgi:predicted enzyme related to lactoylglutathione lyase
MANSEVQFESVAPSFIVREVVKTAEYYRDVLGFEISGYFLDPPVFASVRRGRCEVFFGKADAEAGVSNSRLKKIGIDAFFWVSGLDALADEIKRSGGKIIEGPVSREYNVRELVVGDCNGFVLAFAS